MTTSDISAGHSVETPKRRSAPQCASEPCECASAYMRGAHHTHGGLTPIDAQAVWPVDRRELWRAEELIHRAFAGAVVISEESTA
jgi:hypothetical protein